LLRQQKEIIDKSAILSSIRQKSSMEIKPVTRCACNVSSSIALIVGINAMSDKIPCVLAYSSTNILMPFPMLGEYRSDDRNFNSQNYLLWRSMRFRYQFVFCLWRRSLRALAVETIIELHLSYPSRQPP
jgi:hypothetical protein